MLALVSPAKTLDFESPPAVKNYTIPDFLEQSQELVAILRQYSAQDLEKLMGVSPKIAALNQERFQDFRLPFKTPKAKQAVFAFHGDVYEGLNIRQFNARDIEYAQNHLRILSGLYGLLRPLDLMMPYRLEMGTKLKNKRGSHLYAFWGDRLTKAVNESAQGKAVINLASQEYAKAIQPKQLSVPWIDVVFKDKVRGAYQVVGIHAKRARGLMVAFLIRERIAHRKDIKDFTDEGYLFNEAMSQDNQLVFCRG